MLAAQTQVEPLEVKKQVKKQVKSQDTQSVSFVDKEAVKEIIKVSKKKKVIKNEFIQEQKMPEIHLRYKENKETKGMNLSLDDIHQANLSCLQRGHKLNKTLVTNPELSYEAPNVRVKSKNRVTIDIEDINTEKLRYKKGDKEVATLPLIGLDALSIQGVAEPHKLTKGSRRGYTTARLYSGHEAEMLYK